jgi:hypothetical protein
MKIFLPIVDGANSPLVELNGMARIVALILPVTVGALIVMLEIQIPLYSCCGITIEPEFVGVIIICLSFYI